MTQGAMRHHTKLPWFMTGRLSLILAIFICVAIYITRTCEGSEHSPKDEYLKGSDRRLLFDQMSSPVSYDSQCNIVVNVSSEANIIPWETCAYEESVGYFGLWMFMYIASTLVIFVALAIVCDDFFVPSLSAISEKLNLSEDVAGATFMAAGSSAPELFSSIAAVSFNSDVGVGTITGSAVFNLLVIISLSAAFAGRVLHLDWRPLMRDTVFYMASIAFFVYSVWDAMIQIWEAVALLLLYLLYIVVMFYNQKLMSFLGKLELKIRLLSQTTTPSGDGAVALGSAKVKDGAIVDNGDMSSKDVAIAATACCSNRRESHLSHDSFGSGEQKVFHHHRRNSVIMSIVSSRPSIRSDERGISIPRSGQRHSLANTNNTAKDESPIREIDEDGISENTLSMGSRDNKPPPPPMYNSHHRATRPTEICDLSTISTTNNADAAAKRSAEVEEEVEKEGEEEEEEVMRLPCCCECCPPIRAAPPERPGAPPAANCGDGVDAGADGRKEAWHSTAAHTALYALKWVVFVLALPFLVLFSWTIPDCSKPHNKHRFLFSFTTSVLWIAALSFAMVTIVARVGCLIHVDSYVMSLVFLAAGTSIPDLLGSIIVVRGGYGDMAVSNAIGSNVFDINLGLGLPFLIRIAVERGKPFDVLNPLERYAYCTGGMSVIPHVKFSFILLGLLAATTVCFAAVRFRLNKQLGIFFFLLYLCFLLYAFLQEFLCNKTGKYNC